ncbi:hypothetical protein [Hydrogenophaga sp.]|nr:hypothetical protein [Hydrogenophaga sp.]MDP1686847.1 hypothetical protein [Hydrogenophaga sp.]
MSITVNLPVWAMWLLVGFTFAIAALECVNLWLRVKLSRMKGRP